MELAMIRQFIQDPQRIGKIVYIAPSKALCGERHADWSSKFQRIFRKTALLTGDTEVVDTIEDVDLIVTTPEKWDSITRRWADHRNFLNKVSLMLIDEVHIVKESRGSSLEVIVSRMRTMKRKVGSAIRYIATSATIPNATDFAHWLSSSDGSPAECLTFGDSDRAVPLEKFVYSAPIHTRNPYVFDLGLNHKLPGIIKEHSNRQPSLVFCNTRKSCEVTAKSLADSLKIKNGHNELTTSKSLNGT